MIIARGFTLIEAMAATALSAIMMTALMSVTTAIVRNGPDETTTDQPASWRRHVIEVFRRDLAHADTVQASPSRVVLTGHVSLDRETSSPTHQPAVVTYSLKRVADRSWLLRTQVDLEDHSLHNTWVQIVCAGVLSFEVQTGDVAVDDPDLSTPAPAIASASETESPQPIEAFSGQSVLTDAADLTITWDDKIQSTTSVVLLSR